MLFLPPWHSGRHPTPRIAGRVLIFQTLPCNLVQVLDEIAESLRRCPARLAEAAAVAAINALHTSFGTNRGAILVNYASPHLLAPLVIPILAKGPLPQLINALMTLSSTRRSACGHPGAHAAEFEALGAAVIAADYDRTLVMAVLSWIKHLLGCGTVLSGLLESRLLHGILQRISATLEGSGIVSKRVSLLCEILGGLARVGYSPRRPQFPFSDAAALLLRAIEVSDHSSTEQRKASLDCLRTLEALLSGAAAAAVVAIAAPATAILTSALMRVTASASAMLEDDTCAISIQCATLLQSLWASCPGVSVGASAVDLVPALCRLAAATTGGRIGGSAHRCAVETIKAICSHQRRMWVEFIRHPPFLEFIFAVVDPSKAAVAPGASWVSSGASMSEQSGAVPAIQMLQALLKDDDAVAALVRLPMPTRPDDEVGCGATAMLSCLCNAAVIANPLRDTGAALITATMLMRVILSGRLEAMPPELPQRCSLLCTYSWSRLCKWEMSTSGGYRRVWLEPDYPLLNLWDMVFPGEEDVRRLSADAIVDCLGWFTRILQDWVTEYSCSGCVSECGEPPRLYHAGAQLTVSRVIVRN